MGEGVRVPADSVGPACETCGKALTRPAREAGGSFVRVSGVVVKGGQMLCPCPSCGATFDLLNVAAKVRVRFPEPKKTG